MTTASPDRTFRAPEVCKLTGISYRQCDYWTRTGLVTATIKWADGSGSQREYSFGDVVAIATIKSLLDTGISLQKVRDAVRYLQETDDLSIVTLVSDGNRIYAARTDRDVIDLLGQGGGIFAIALGPIVEGLVTRIEERRSVERATT